MELNIKISWDSSDKRWEIFNKNPLNTNFLDCKPHKAVIQYPLYYYNNKFCIMTEAPIESCGIIGFSNKSFKEILGVKRATSLIRNSPLSTISVNQWILKQQYNEL